MQAHMSLAALFLLGPGTVSSVALQAQQGLPPIPYQVGQPFPNILLPSLDGRPMSIADFRGHKLILHIFASW